LFGIDRSKFIEIWMCLIQDILEISKLLEHLKSM
jgi:hypothetical protein